MAEWKIKNEKTEKTEDESMELEGEEEAKDEDEEPEEKEDIETEEAEEQEELSKEESESAEEKSEEGGENFRISRIDFSGIRTESLESEVEETGGGKSESEGRESFEDFASPMSVREIPPSALVSAPATGGIEGEVGGITEAQSSRERREQAARTPIADYTAGAYERNYWVGEREGARRDIEMSIIPLKPKRDIMEIPDETRRIDFSAWQRSMETQDVRRTRQGERTNSEEYLVDVRREKEETRLPFERREEKRKYRP